MPFTGQKITKYDIEFNSFNEFCRVCGIAGYTQAKLLKRYGTLERAAAAYLHIDNDEKLRIELERRLTDFRASPDRKTGFKKGAKQPVKNNDARILVGVIARYALDNVSLTDKKLNNAVKLATGKNLEQIPGIDDQLEQFKTSLNINDI